MNTPAIDISSFTQAAGNDYQAKGYVVVRKLIPESAIDRLLDNYRRDIVPSGGKFYRQNTNRYEANVITSHGYVANCFLDIHAFYRYEAVRLTALDILFHKSMMEKLTEITGSAKHNLMQSMLFDFNTATPPHQDWWYLDSVPHGQLLAAWIALEDIHEDAGRFYVIPNSHTVDLHTVAGANLSHTVWLKRMRQYVDVNQDEISAPALQKGDVMFWNSRTIHGALPTRDNKFSRKSLTAHYLPSHLSFGNLFTTKHWVTYRQHNEHFYFANQPEYSLKAMLMSKVKQAVYDRPGVLRLMRKFQRHSISDS